MKESDQEVNDLFEALLTKVEMKQAFDVEYKSLVHLGMEAYPTLRPRYTMFETPHTHLRPEVTERLLGCLEEGSPDRQLFTLLGRWGANAEIDALLLRIQSFPRRWRYQRRNEAIRALHGMGGAWDMQCLAQWASSCATPEENEEAQAALYAMEDIASLEDPSAAEGGQMAYSPEAEGLWRQLESRLTETSYGRLVATVERAILNPKASRKTIALAKETWHLVLAGAEVWLTQQAERTER